jgi:hypothetical protein
VNPESGAVAAFGVEGWDTGREQFFGLDAGSTANDLTNLRKVKVEILICLDPVVEHAQILRN